MVRDAVLAGDLRDLRCAGGHFHISYDTAIAPPWVGAMLCDHFIGFPHRLRLNKSRSPYYGQATLHRPTHYPNGDSGVEYRPMDSFWVHGPDVRVIRGLGLVQQLLTPEYVDAARSLVDLHIRMVPPYTILADFAEAEVIRGEARTIMTSLAPALAEEYHDSI